MEKAYLVLENGDVFEGTRLGAPVDSVGELVFNTGMSGYIETLTDPSYYGQIVLFTFPTIGNYGIIPADFEGACVVRGCVMREWCDAPSNFRAEEDLDRFLKEQGVVGIAGVDTRHITKLIRESGVMNAMICAKVPENTDVLRTYRVEHAVESVSANACRVYPAEGGEKFRVTLVDYGAKRGIIQDLVSRGCTVKAVPYHTPAADILADAPDGVMLSNGPGDPAENGAAIAELRKLMGRVPVFGICLGHQLMALAQGGRTGKLKYGHRGGNQPVRDAETGKCYITSQNHGYAVLPDALPQGGVLRFTNVNDGTCEGIDYPELRAFSVQFHPEARPGPEDTAFLFDRFLDMMSK